MKTWLGVLLVMAVCAVSPLHAEELKSAPSSPVSEARYLPRNYLLTVTIEKMRPEPYSVSMLVGGRMAELSLIDPFMTISVTPTLRENDRCLLDYRIGFRVKVGAEQWVDEGVKGAAYLPIGKDVTILEQPGRTIKLKFSLPVQ